MIDLLLSALIGACKVALILLPIVGSALIGYFFGAYKTFREQKVQAYEEILPVFIEAAFEPDRTDQQKFNLALTKLWLYANREVAHKVNEVLGIMIHPKKGDMIPALQAAIAEMRKDIQFFRGQTVEPKEVGHFYTKFGIRK